MELLIDRARVIVEAQHPRAVGQDHQGEALGHAPTANQPDGFVRQFETAVALGRRRGGVRDDSRLFTLVLLERIAEEKHHQAHAQLCRLEGIAVLGDFDNDTAGRGLHEVHVARRVAKHRNPIWHVDLTAVTTSADFWAPWLAFALPQCGPFC